jgi:hypothetical protein
MALTPLHSSQYLVSTTKPVQRVDGSDWGAAIKSSLGSLVFTVAGTGTANMITLPAGRKIIIPDYSRIVCPQGTATATLSVGHNGFTKPDGTVVAADGAAFASVLAVGAGAIDQSLPLPAVGYFVLDSRGPVDITATIATANSPASGEMLLLLLWAAVGK